MYTVKQTEKLLTASFSSELKLIDQLIQDIAAFLNHKNISTHNQINTVVRELCVNSIEHGNNFNFRATINFSLVSFGGQRFKITVEDDGNGFDLSMIDMKLSPHDFDEKKDRGIPVVNSLSDELKYENGGRRAIVYIRIKSDADTTNLEVQDSLTELPAPSRSAKTEFLFTKRNDFLVYGAPALGEEEVNELVDVLRSGWIGTGPRVSNFEQLFGNYKEVTSPVALASCTAALHLSLLASGIRSGDEVITTAMTFCATINAIIHSGARPIIVDIDPKTNNLDPDHVERAITKMTKAIIPVHYGGFPCDMDALTNIATKHNLIIIEDCAHAIETEYRGRKAGTFGEFGCFSFYVTKNLVTGEGGMLIAKNDKSIDKIRMLSLHGMTRNAWKRFSDDGYKHYQVEEAGYKYNMTDMQAALGIHQLARIDENWDRRKAIWSEYQTRLKHFPIILPEEPKDYMKHAYHIYPICIPEASIGLTRDQFVDEFTKRNIGVGVHFLSIADHLYYQRRFGWISDNYPNAKNFGRATLSLPLSPKLTDRDVDYVISALADIVPH